MKQFICTPNGGSEHPQPTVYTQEYDTSSWLVDLGVFEAFTIYIPKNWRTPLIKKILYETLFAVI